MNHQQETALQKSIDHWKRLATRTRNENELIGPAHCALCVEFYNQDCACCPVRNKTGKTGCKDTPWSDIEDVMPSDSWEDGPEFMNWLNSDEFVALAEKELAFLISLCPKQIGS